MERMPGEYGLEGDEPICTEEIEGRLESSWYVTSPWDSTALVATEAKGACRFWLIGTCWPVL